MANHKCSLREVKWVSNRYVRWLLGGSGGRPELQEPRLGLVAAHLYGPSVTEDDVGGRITTG